MRTEQQNVCKICGGAGFVRRDVPVDHPDFGRAVPCQCKTVEMIGSDLSSMRKVSGLSHLGQMTFESFRPDLMGLTVAQVQNLRDAFEAVWAYASLGQGWLLIKGGYGCGKTHLAAAIANERLNHGEPVLFVLVPDLLDHLRSAFAPSIRVGPFNSILDS
jgi:DNA replication protein DnaC